MGQIAELLNQIEGLEVAKRDALKTDLQKCTPKQQEIFKRMYAHWAEDVARTRTPPNDEMLSIPIDEVVDNMPEGRLDWAMQQVNRSMEKAND